MKSNLYKAYDRIHPDNTERAKRLSSRLDDLLHLAQSVESPLLRRMKPTMVVSIKWRFDYLIKTQESPFELEKDIEHWITILETFKTLGHLDWFEMDKNSKIIDPWQRTAQGFDLGWTTTTEGPKFEASKKIAIDRLEQLYEILGGSNWFSGKEVLDSGCGPGRYIDEIRKLNPKHIVGLDQGLRLVDVNRERFKNDDKVEIVHGTCEDLSRFEDNKFDFVFSNGVIHHTKSDLLTMFKDHQRVLKPGGWMFIMLVGKGGLELKVWEFIRDLLNDVPLEQMLEVFGPAVSSLRLQGIVDHMYGEYQETPRAVFESWCKPLFNRVERVHGVAGLDVTPELFKDDPYFDVRFGDGANLRYMLQK
jgi:ubiquinone/menaquinone biosynthesis C-methylase UbiE